MNLECFQTLESFKEWRADKLLDTEPSMAGELRAVSPPSAFPAVLVFQWFTVERYGQREMKLLHQWITLADFNEYEAPMRVPKGDGSKDYVELPRRLKPKAKPEEKKITVIRALTLE